MFDKLYKQFSNVWGYEPSGLAKKAAKELPANTTILDVGAGEGKDSIFFASLGHQVTAVESSINATESMKKRIAEKGDLSIHIIVDSIVEMKLKPDKYDLIFAHMCLQFMTRGQRIEVLQKFRASVKKGGLLAISQFTVEEPAWQRLQSSGDHVVGLCTLRFRDHVVNFAQLGEYKQEFAKDHVLHYWEGTARDEGHPGFEEPHTHGVVSVIAKIVAKPQSDR
jgi:SAM-dependent methyltransferase